MSAGAVHSCGIRTGGSLECWGYDDGDGRSSPPSGSFTAVSAGGSHSCGIRTRGTVECWGWTAAAGRRRRRDLTSCLSSQRENLPASAGHHATAAALAQHDHAAIVAAMVAQGATARAIDAETVAQTSRHRRAS
ncbi:MAG: RCC1 domain-containing protein [Acidimicrobiaceae bacterium]|nr:RCC1 domain-containing protein [Acidimicrobiaceae bacterium]